MTFNNSTIQNNMVLKKENSDQFFPTIK